MLDPYQLLLSRRNDRFPDPVYQWSVYHYGTCATRMFNTRGQAILYRSQLSGPSQIFYHCFDKQMARLNWCNEPQESLSELMKQRALELRDTYRYLRLWLSGGSDCMTALSAFVDNEIPVDEIVIHLYANDSINRFELFNKQSVLDVAIPYLQKNSHYFRNTKITMYRSDLHSLSQWHLDPARLGHVNHLDGLDLGWQLRFGVTAAMTLMPDPKINPWCDVMGGQKAKICLRNNRWYSYDVDLANATSARATTSEDFFISKSVPTLYLKTVWMLRRYCEGQALSAKQIDSLHKVRESEGSTLESRKIYNLAMGRMPLPDSAYHKSGSQPEQDDAEFIKRSQAEDHPAVKIYLENRKLLTADTRFMDQPGILSRFYCLNDGLSYDSQGIW